MTTIEQLDYELAARGWYYDRGKERFMAGATQLSWNDVIGLLPGEHVDEAVNEQDGQYDICAGCE